MKILYVEDEPNVAKAVNRLLQREGHQMEWRDSVSAAKDSLSNGESFDLVLCDMMLGDGTGVDLHRWLRETGNPAATRMVFVTGGYPPSLASYILGSGVPVFDKPFDLDEVLGGLVGPATA